MLLDTDLRVNTANRSVYETFQVSSFQVEQTYFFELGNKQWNIPHLRSALEDIIINNCQIQNFEVEHYFEQIGQKTMLLSAWKLQ